MANADTTATHRITLTNFFVNGRKGQLATFRGGRLEVYREDAEIAGLMQFVGYYDDICHTHPRVCEAVHPFIAQHEAHHRSFWSSFLPGAVVWLNVA